jgi:hypothetical protein
MRLISFLGLLSLLLSACSPQENEASSRRGQTNTPVENTATILFSCTSLSEDETMPRFQVNLEVNGNAYVMDTISQCAQIEVNAFSNYDIPSEAISATGGWWAGAGDYFYATLDGADCVVWYGWQDEMQTDEGFHYEELRRIRLN